MVTPEGICADLDPDQRAAVTTPSRLVAVIAGAGSGKTRVLTRRIGYRIATDDATAAHTLVMTFTREAAGELRRRLPRLGVTERITAGTFHAVAHRLLQQRWEDTDQAPWTILEHRSRFIRSVIGPTADPSVIADIEWACARGITPDHYVRQARASRQTSRSDPNTVADAFAAFVAEKRSRRLLDLDDMLSFTCREMEADQGYADSLRWRFQHLYVDEAQDLNPLQYRFVNALREGQDDLFMVGDPAQSIFGFTGSDPDVLIHVADRFPGIEIVRLPVNHRCTPEIVAAGVHVLAQGGQDANLVSARDHGAAVRTIAHPDEVAEADAIAGMIASASDPSDLRRRRVAVLARTHAVLDGISTALANRGVHQWHPVDAPNTPLGRLLNEATRLSTANDLRRFAFDAADRADSSDDALHQVATVIQDFLLEHPTGDGARFRLWLSTSDPFQRSAGGVELLTFHGAKGREWPFVHIAGAETSLVPHRSAKTAAARAEEARLFYVAVTRGSEDVTIHHAARRNGYRRQLTPLLDNFVSCPPRPVRRPERVAVRPGAPASPLPALREWRNSRAVRAGVLPEEICPDGTLVRIARSRPGSADELTASTGIGAITARNWWHDIEAILANEG